MTDGGEMSEKVHNALHTAINLFDLYGFHQVGVDRLMEEAKISKTTFYNHFQSKERLIEMCLIFQKNKLEERVLAIIYSYKGLRLTTSEKLKQIYLLHVDIQGLYHLLFKALLEIEKLYPKAYQIAVWYRQWLKKEVFDLLTAIRHSISAEDANLFLFVIDGAMVQFLSSNKMNEREALWGYWEVWWQ